MKLLSILLLFILNLQANMFDYNTDGSIKAKTIYDLFNQCTSDMNSIVKHGEYEKHINFEKNIVSVEKGIIDAQMDSNDRQSIQKNLREYKLICQTCINTMKNDAPQLNTHYTNLVNNLENFKKSVYSTGYQPLIKEWDKLTRIKKQYIKDPSNKLENKFARSLDQVVLTLTQLYLDDEQEQPMLTYLKNYQSYFNDLSRSYKSVKYENINEIKPLSYKIKSQIKLSIPYSL